MLAREGSPVNEAAGRASNHQPQDSGLVSGTAFFVDAALQPLIEDEFHYNVSVNLHQVPVFLLILFQAILPTGELP